MSSLRTTFQDMRRQLRDNFASIRAFEQHKAEQALGRGAHDPLMRPFEIEERVCQTLKKNVGAVLFDKLQRFGYQRASGAKSGTFTYWVEDDPAFPDIHVASLSNASLLDVLNSLPVAVFNHILVQDILLPQECKIAKAKNTRTRNAIRKQPLSKALAALGPRSSPR